ncbi:ribose transport system ATP-binding protein [Allocatelliglobosispora scoriae]|uniref:Ribose transport system ATP-binding protein n=1 Tax=Allocatelliglobosispora scoriae TaxID=643052 RepID=A0A841BLZ7_9ACTN|nr:sugar ABC transporter ATP-binding protein [Allocatelliglobosispora scoriae]MBB5868378.1 ribose transport system ATP-binding protein [Allocatelliglobosispora scoriae]
MMLLAEKLTKTFPGVRALDGATLAVRAGSVHALLGENGAGKSTLVKLLTGVYKPEAGRILLDGAPVQLGSPIEALRAGIGVVHQERNLVPEFSIAENIALQHLPRRFGLVDRRRMRAEAQRCLDLLDLQLDPDAKVAGLSVAQAQLVEIAKALSVDSRVLLLDEPTASLTGDEADRLYAIVRKLTATGHAVVLVSHKLEEVFAVADTVTVLRDGHSVAEAEALSAYTRDQIVDLMVGREYRSVALADRVAGGRETPALSLSGVSTRHGHRDVSLAVAPGEILGLYGLVGAGRTELARAVLGLDEIIAGQVAVHGKPVRIRDVGEALRSHRIGYVSENRKEEGLFLEQPITRNVAVTVWRRLAKAGLIPDQAERKVVADYTELLGIRAASPQQLAGQLSGGNQQKVSLAKWLAAECDILIVDEPTVGIDVRTKAAFHELIARLASEGRAILLISSDLPEVITLADRVAVMGDRTILGELPNDRDYAAMSQRIIRLIHAPVAASLKEPA